MKARLWMALAMTGAAAMGLAGACSSDAGGDTSAGGSNPTTTTTSSTTAGGGGSGGSGGALPGADCATVTGVIAAEGQAIHYLVSLDAGQFWILEANAPGLDIQATDYDYANWIDTVVSLYTEDGSTLLATIDDSFPRYSTDSSLVYRAVTAGVFCVKVEDWGSWAGAVRPVQANNTFEFGVLTPTDPADGNVFDTEANDSVADSQAQTYNPSATNESLYATMFGGLDTQADVDVYTVVVPTGISGLQISDFTPRSGPGAPGTGVNGTNGNGSTLELGLINVTDEAGTDIIAQLDAARPAARGDSRNLFMPLTGGQTYHLWVQRAAGSTAGSNDFYDIVQTLIDSTLMNQAEAEAATGTNDTAATAEIPTAASPAGPNPQYFILGHMNSGSDTDFWRFPATAGNQIALSCTAVRSGSGLTGATFAVVGTDQSTVLQTETETEDADIFWYTSADAESSMDGVAVATTGNYYLRVTATGQKLDVSGTYYICGITVVVA
jgi:hypothetical protein